jgi:hypothetical protein
MAAASINLSLVSHTNAGKTTLARTLLARDVGTVRDAPHVTEFADAFTLLETPQGDTLRLWDTPGFGDSVRLASRMRQSGNPLGWFMSEVWDRWRDRPFWSSQQALRNVREQADVVLYLVNAAEEPAAAGYVVPEMELLAWVGKPVIVLLNQLGAPREAALEDADVQRWRDHLAADPHAGAQVRAVLPLDAFARCWVQEYTLLRAITQTLRDEQAALMQRLADAWLAQRRATFDAAMAALARSLARIATTNAVLPEASGLRARLRQVGAALGMGKGEDGPQSVAQRALADAMSAEVRASTAQLIAMHGLDGQAQGEILQRLATHYETRLRLNESNAAALGGMLTGALAGLKADVATGGLTLGGGMLAGGILGALGAAGLARAYNLVRGTEQSWLTWNAQAMDSMLDAALLRYLAVAHFGRGRGEWAQGESPPHWKAVVEAAMAPYTDALDEVWGGRSARAAPAAKAEEVERLARELVPLLTPITLDALSRLYPGAEALAALALADGTISLQ